MTLLTLVTVLVPEMSFEQFTMRNDVCCRAVFKIVNGKACLRSTTYPVIVQMVGFQATSLQFR
jgi:hypothetical protein